MAPASDDIFEHEHQNSILMAGRLSHAMTPAAPSILVGRRPQEQQLRAMPELQQLLSLLTRAGSLVVLVGPFEDARTRDDGVRIVSEPEETRRMLEIYRDLLRQLHVGWCQVGAGTVAERAHAVAAAMGKSGGCQPGLQLPQ